MCIAVEDLLAVAAVALFAVVVAVVHFSLALLSPEQLEKFRSEKLYSG